MEEQKIFVAKTTEIGPLEMKSFKLGPRPALIVNTGRGFKAYWNFCTHMGGTVKIRDGCFKCQWHGATFDIPTGRALTGPAPEGSGLSELPVMVEGDDVFVIWQPPE